MDLPETDGAYDFVNSGALVPLTKTLARARPGYNLGDVSPERHRCRWSSQDGVLYAYPFSTSPFAVFVNNDLDQEGRCASRRRPS